MTKRSTLQGILMSLKYLEWATGYQDGVRIGRILRQWADEFGVGDWGRHSYLA